MRFLVIDDSASLRRYLKKRLQDKWLEAEVEGYDPGRRGRPYDQFPWNNYDVVFLDYYLGFEKETGLDWIPRIKKKKPAPAVIMITGEGDESIAAQSIKCGADFYLIKYDLGSELLFETVLQAIADLAPTAQDLWQQATVGQTGELNDTKPGETDESSQDTTTEVWKIPGYKVLEEIAGGNWSTTLHAKKKDTDSDVILKVQDIHEVTDSSLLKRFMQELNILSDLQHPNVVKILGHGHTDDYAYYVMDYLPNGDLASRIEKGEITVDKAIDYVIQIAKGLSVLHEKDIVHRDMKPSNILFDKDNHPVITDLGIAKDLSSAEELTARGEILGTPFYISPEQINGKPVDKRTDIYSLGVLFYEMLTGERPFHGGSVIEVAYQHAYDEPPPLPVELAAYQPLLEKLLAKNPDDRYESMEDFIAEIDVILI